MKLRRIEVVTTVPYPPRFNDSWSWLKTVSVAMGQAGEPFVRRSLMLHTCEQAFLRGGFAECILEARQYVTIEEPK